MYKCECGRSFTREYNFLHHKKTCKGPKYCQNPECNKLLTEVDQKKFCCLSCSAIVSNTGKKHSTETKIKISLSLGGNGSYSKKIKCLFCGKETTNPKYCSKECEFNYRTPNEYKYKNYISRKKILWVEQNKQCNHCGFDLYNYKNGPYEIHHKDGNKLNRNRDNEELLCCNCHYLTDNHRFKGRKHTKKAKKKISEARKHRDVA